MAYKGYNPANSKHVQKYNAKHYKTVGVVFDREFYEHELKPLCESLDVSCSSFIKNIVIDYLKNNPG